MTKPVLIYDGECQFCQNSLDWLCIKAEVEAVSFHVAPLSEYGLTNDQLYKSVAPWILKMWNNA